MSARDILERWRPSATPGAPSAAGVPADRVAERSAELEGVLALLQDAQVEAQSIRSAAAAEATRRRAAAQEQGRTLIAEAQRNAQANRSAAAASAHAAGQESAGRIRAQAQLEAEAIVERAAARQPALIAHVREQARARIAEITQGAP